MVRRKGHRHLTKTFAKKVFADRWGREKEQEIDARRIPRPPALGRKEQGGLDFVRPALVWLRDHYPDDYRRWLIDFPFAEVQTI